MGTKNIAIIGAGQLGRRHLQAVAKVTKSMDIYIVEPSAENLKLAMTMFNNALKTQNPTNDLSTAAIPLQSVDQLPDVIDLAIIATSADVRLELIRSLIVKSKVENLILEKLVFQSVREFDLARSIMGSLVERTWVNTARRAMNLHRAVKNFLDEDQVDYFGVAGGLWGLGTSSIHMLDLLDFFQPGTIDAVNTELLNDEILESKRAGFYEISGTLSGRLGKANYSLLSEANQEGPLTIHVKGKNRACLINETNGKVIFFDEKNEHTKQFPQQYVSELTTKIVEDIFEGHVPMLPNFYQSEKLHIPLIEALSGFFNKKVGTPKSFVPLT